MKNEFEQNSIGIYIYRFELSRLKSTSFIWI